LERPNDVKIVIAKLIVHLFHKTCLFEIPTLFHTVNYWLLKNCSSLIASRKNCAIFTLCTSKVIAAMVHVRERISTIYGEYMDNLAPQVFRRLFSEIGAYTYTLYRCLPLSFVFFFICGKYLPHFYDIFMLDQWTRHIFTYYAY